MIRVLIVDDSPTMRMLIRNVLESDPEISVVGEAMDGEQAIKLAQTLVPDLITMDLQMPKINGFEAIQEIMSTAPCPIIVLTSSTSDNELGVSFKAMEVGAISVIVKPRGSVGKDIEAVDLIQQVKTLAGVKVIQRRNRTAGGKFGTGQLGPLPATKSDNNIRLIAIGASTGGPPAIQVILKSLSPDIGLPVVIVQHISAGFVAGLVRWLDETTPWHVEIAEHQQIVKPGSVYFAPDHHHLCLGKANRIQLSNQPPLGGHRPSVTKLFESVAKVYGKNAIGILLTGMGRDGADGLKTMYDAGACTIAQNEATSVIFGMPYQAILLGAAQEVLALEKIAPWVNARVGLKQEAQK